MPQFGSVTAESKAPEPCRALPGGTFMKRIIFHGPAIQAPREKPVDFLAPRMDQAGFRILAMGRIHLGSGEKNL
jgi:hypothetical protein